MARQVLPIVGAVVGAYFGNPALGYAVGAAIGNAVDPLVVQGPKIGDTAIQTSAEGAYRAIVYGTAAVAGNLIWTGPKIIRKEKEQAAKGGGPVTEYERLFQSFAIRICEGPISGILRIWEDEKLVYDVREGSTIPEESTKFASRFVLHLGGEDQLPDSEIESVLGIGNAPAYRGSAYIVFPKADLTDRRGSIPQYRFEVVARDADITWSPKVVTSEAYFTGTYDDLTQQPSTTFGTVNPSAKPLAVSPDGTLTASCWFSAPYLRVYRFDRESESFQPVTITGLVPDGICDTVAFSSDQNWMAVGNRGTRKLMVYRVTESGLEFFASPVTGAETNVVHIRFCPTNSLRIGCSMTGEVPVKIFLIRSVPGDVMLLRQSVAVYSAGENAGLVEWRPDGLMICQTNGTKVFIFNVESANPMPYLFSQNLLLLGVRADRGAYWSEFLDFFYFTSGSAPYITVFRLLHTGEDAYVLDRYPDPVQPGAGIYSAALSFDRRYLLVAPIGLGLRVYSTNLMERLTLVSDVGTGTQRYIALNDGLSVGSGTSVPDTLSAIVSDITDRCGLSDSDYDASELIDPVAGFVLAGGYTGASAINALRAPYFFDASEYDGVIHFPKRGKPVVRTLTFDDLIDEPETSTREDAREFPAKLHLEYQNAISGYETAKATSARSSTDVRVTGETSVSVPVVMDSTEAQKTVVKLHKVAWTDQEGELPFSISDEHLDLVAADNIGLALRGSVFRLRIEKFEHAAGEIKLTCRHDRQSAYTANVTGVPLPEPTPPPNSIVGATQLAILDIPALVDINDLANPVEYAAMSGISEAWYGATLQRSLDGGSSFGSVLQDSSGTVMGTLLQELPGASEFYRDRTNRVVVALSNPSDVLEDLSESSFLSEGGAFALEKAGGGWEILQYKDVDEDSAGNWVLSDLLRGRLDSGASAHAVGARFVLLAGVKVLNVTSGLIGQTVLDRAVSSGTAPETATPQGHTVTAQSQREWPVASLRVRRDGSTISADWAPRHRFGTELNPIASINFQGFRVVLNDGVAPPVSFDTTSPSFTYDASSLGSSVTVSVSSINRITGLGPATSETV
ncbi:Putative phage tail protein [Xanthomonas sp. GW]|uniref:phage tail protein n=1 Tax=Xanthomonas sp. GW TaxID=2724121 RepID=UPI001639B0B4|nr:phage tail protein [Xanthomonas sp. GW]QNH21270.1 Putative phage tail protein [Xanthomonas sp. GW]